VSEAFAGVVLTGGRSERMGRDKALLVIDGETMAARVARALIDAGATEVLCVGGDVEGLRALGLQAVVDDHLDAGPLGGLLTGMARGAEPITVVTPCDLVAPSAASFRSLVRALAGGGADALAALPVVGGRWRPLPAALRSSAGPLLAEAFAEGERAVHRAMECLEFVAIDVGALTDADAPEDLPGRR
jgi:molybdopterin-guanine dinucleotide biosynthesis protein A